MHAFRAVYQPIVELGADPTLPIGGAGGPTLVGYEALLRASGPNGPVMPAELFAAAEQAGWLHILDRIGRTTALRGAGGWLGDARLFVNFLPTTIYRPEVCLATTEAAAKAAGLRLDQVVFEVTESERIFDLDHLAMVFAYYRERGCQVALDDLGAGYSSLNTLVRLQPDVVKLDKDIVQHLPDPASCAVVSAVVEITHAYGGQVLAECIETAEQARTARELGVDLGQGWYFGRPGEAPLNSRSATTAPIVVHPSTVATLNTDGNDPAVALTATSSPAPGGSEPGAALPPAIEDPRSRADIAALLARAVQVANTGVSISDLTSRDQPLIYVNEAFEEMTGYRRGEALGQNCRFLQVPATDVEAVRQLREAIAEGRDHVAVLRNRRKNGDLWWNELRLSAVHDDSGALTHYFGFQNDVTARVEAERQVRHLATHDHLTGLPNRASVLQALEQALLRARADGTQVAVMFVDLDGFKKVNDTLGHGAGDLALIATAARLRGTLREVDVLGRQSGDEFVAVLSGVPSHLAGAIAQRAADAVRDSFDSPLNLDGEAVTLSASIGVAVFPEHGSTAGELIGAADQAMYAAKAAGRRGFAVASPPA